MFLLVLNPPPYFEAEYCLFCGRRRVAVARYRMICLVLDHPFQSTEVNLGKKQKWCSLWCPWSQVQQDTSGPDNFRILGCLWTIHHRCTCKWFGTEMLTVSFPLRAKTVCNLLRMNTGRCRREEGHNSAKTTKILLTRNSSILMMSSSEYLFLESECSFTKYVSSCPKTKYLYLRLRLWRRFE